MVLIGVFYLTTMFMGLGAATLVGKADIGPHLQNAAAIHYIARHPENARQLNAKLARDGYIVPEQNNNLAAPLLANNLGGPYLMAFVAAVAFATILAVVAGLAIAASSAFAHDIWWNVVRSGQGDEVEQLRVARATAVAVGAISIALALALRGFNVTIIVGLAFAIAASANVPAIVLSLIWKRFNRAGALVGMLTGLISSLALIAISPSFMGAAALFPINNPGIVSIPLGFIAAIVGTLCSRDEQAELSYNQLVVRANTGMGAEI
jgi:cation/acetate symporter